MWRLTACCSGPWICLKNCWGSSSNVQIERRKWNWKNFDCFDFKSILSDCDTYVVSKFHKETNFFGIPCSANANCDTSNICKFEQLSEAVTGGTMLFPKVKHDNPKQCILSFQFFTVLKFRRLHVCPLLEEEQSTEPGRRRGRVSSRSTRQKTGLKRWIITKEMICIKISIFL